MNCIRYVLLWILLGVAPLYAQQKETRIDFGIQEATLETFVRQLEKATGYSLAYGEQVVLARPVTLDVRRQTVGEILSEAFRSEAITFKITGRHILLQKSARRFTISGYITDDKSSETLIGANVQERLLRHAGASTNPFGFYTLTLPEGEAQLAFSYLGYDLQACRFWLNKDTLLNIRLTANNQLAEVVVLSDKKEAGIYSTAMGAHEIPLLQIRNTPAILGESDLLKTIQLLPGVQAGMEGFSGLYVRGGGPDQNLILLDGIPVYNADHLLGVFSVFTSEAIKNVTLFKSSFPARFGGRLSSVVDIRTNDGDMKNFHGTISLGLLTSKVHLEGPILKDRTSFCVTARRTYLDLLAKPFMEENEKYNYYFYDVNAKVNHKFSDRSRLYLSVYNGKDHYSYKRDQEYSEGLPSVYIYNNDLNFDWGNTLVSGRWNYVFNNKLFSNTTVAYNRYQMSMGNTFKEENNGTDFSTVYLYNSDYRSGIRDWSFQTDFDYTPIPNHRIKFGTTYLFHTFRPEVMTSRVAEAENESMQDTTYNTTTNDRLYGHEVSVYAEDNFNIGNRLSMNLGVHFSLFNTQGKSYFSAQPRLSARYRLGNDYAVKASFSQMAQYVHLLTSSPISLPTDLWVPVTRNIRPMRSDQYAVGGYYTGLKGWEFSLEGYYKNMYNVLEYQEGATFFASSANWEEKVEMGKGRSFGMEVLAQRTAGNTTGWLAYTLAKSDRIFEDGTINNGKRFPYKYDRRHNISICLNHKFSEKIDAGATWVFNTGGTATIAEQRTGTLFPNGGTSGGIIEQDYISSRNNYRLPSSHRLNIGLNFHKRVRRGTHTWNISLYNAYNAMNPNLVFLDREYIYHQSTDENGQEQGYTEYKPKLKKQTLLPCVPSVSYTFKF